MAKIETLDVPDIKISDTRRARVLRQVKEKSLIHRSNHEVEFEIEERMKNFMNPDRGSWDKLDSAKTGDLVNPTEIDPMNPTG